MRYSVIIPIYNCEDHLIECLESIVNQYNDNFELLLINDGSTDNSLAICNEYKNKYSFISVYSKENKGLLLTRRFALKLAKNEWIVWVDADDYLAPNYFEKISRVIENNSDIDMILIKSQTISDDGKNLWTDDSYYHNGRLFKNNKDFYRLFYDLCNDFQINAMWKKIAKKAIYDVDTDYSSYEKVKGEDLLQSVPLLDRAKMVYYLDEPLYNYRLSTNGLGRNLKPKYVKDFQTVYSVLLKYISKKYYRNKSIYKAFSRHYNTYLASLLKALPINTARDDYQDIINRVKSDKVIQKRNKGIYKNNLKTSIRILLFLEMYCTNLFYNIDIIGKKVVMRIKRQ